MYQFENSPFILSVKESENLFQSIINYSHSINLKSAIFTAIGAISNITLGYYHRNTQQHTKRLFQGTYEIASLTGNVTLANEDLFVHIHAAIADNNFQIFGGHLISAEASASTEIAIIPLNHTIKREKHPDLDIKVIRPFVPLANRG
ncbi:PPC domain-containing DNA-binding protein [Legionella sp. 227]|uniref:PPC domain-containing DNA-binding protein n=1 Tax=Legionella sp. 227 TaxID=3367288 RepID=UPI00370D7B47